MDTDKLCILLNKNPKVRHAVAESRDRTDLFAVTRMADCKNLYSDEKWALVIECLARAKNFAPKILDNGSDDSFSSTLSSIMKNLKFFQKSDLSSESINNHDQCDEENNMTAMQNGNGVKNGRNLEHAESVIFCSDRSTTEFVEFAGKVKQKSGHVTANDKSRDQINIYMGYISERDLNTIDSTAHANHNNVIDDGTVSVKNQQFIDHNGYGNDRRYSPKLFA